MANELYSSGVRLWDKNGASASLNNGSGLLLHPETELRYVKPDVGGGISSSVNSLWFDPNAAMVSGLNGVIAGSYCPLEKTNTGAMGGDVQYANMYTGGIASATVTEIHESTGYGTLLHALSTITSVRPTTGANSATNDYIPTERAVALALAGKETTVVGGSCVVVDKEPFSTTIGVNVQTATISALPGAVDTLVPTERSVRLTVDLASGTLNASASALSNRINTLSTYVENSAVKYTDSATADSLGIVKPGYGISAGNSGVLNLVSAPVVSSSGGVSAYQVAWSRHVAHSWGGVVCANEIDSAGLIKYESAAIVPTVQAVYNYVSAHGGGGGAIVSQGVGITVTSDNPLTSYTVKLNAAQASVIGGVQVPQNKGLTLGTSGSLTLQAAPETTNYNDAYTKLTANNIGGVLVTNNINEFFEEGQLTVVPTAAAVAAMFINAVDLPFKIKSTHHDDAADQYGIAAGYVYLNGTFVTYVDSFGGTIPTVGNDITLYLHLTRSSAASNWTVASPSYVTTAGTDNDTNKYIAIGQIMLQHSGESSDIESIRQIQYGNIDLATGTGGQTTIAQGTGITVTGQAATGYTITLNAAQTGTIGGVMVPANVGITLNTNTGAISLNRAGNTSATYGGVWVPTGSGLTLITATTNKGKLYLNEAPMVDTYANAMTSSGTGNLGGVIIMSSLAAAGTGQSSCPVVPTVDAVYQALQTGGGAGYAGPFKATKPNTTSVTVEAGYVVTEYLTHPMPSSSFAAAANTVVCLSGAVQTKGELAAYITGHTYNVAATFTDTGSTYSGLNYVSRANGLTHWSAGGITVWTKDSIPVSGTIAYNNGATASVGEITSCEYITEIRQVADTSSTHVRTDAFGRYNVYTTDIEPNTVTGAAAKLVWYENFNSGTISGSIIASYKNLWAHLSLPIGGRWMELKTDFVGGYTVKTGNPENGTIPIVSLDASRNLTQQQYGNIQLQKTDVETVAQFAVRERAAYGANGTKHKYLIDGTAECMRIELATYKGIEVSGLGVMECAGELYGINVAIDMFTGVKVQRGAWINRYAVKYPEVNITEKEGTTTILTGKTDDALYIVKPGPLDAPKDIWINFGYGLGDRNEWQIEMNDTCYEAEFGKEKWYSVQLAILTADGLTQVHSGPIDIRGRWS